MNEEIQDTQQAEESTSLLDDSAPALQEGEYFLSEGIKGTGDAPDWYDQNNFKSVADQAKSYKELHKKFGSFTGAPKEGYQLPEGFEADDDLIKTYNELMAEANANQDFYNKGFELLQAQISASEEISVQAEMEKLGDNAQERIKTVETFLKNNAGDEYDTIKDLVTDANSIILVEKMINAIAPKKLPINGGEHPQGLTWADVEAEMYKKDENGRLLRSSNPEHNKKVEAMIASFGRQ